MARVRLAEGIAVLRAAVAPFLVMVTPFVIFVQYQRYGFWRAEVLVFVLALAIVSLALGAATRLSPAFGILTLAFLLTLFADIQLDEPGEKMLLAGFLVLCALLWAIRRHAARIVSLMTATILVLSIVPPRRAAVAGGRQPAGPGRSDLPLILHLVLDEHIGIEGLPAELTPRAFKEERRAFFVERGFRLFGRAYSEYPSTLWSLSHVLNLAPGGFVGGLTAAGTSGGTFRLQRNEFFGRLKRQGYAIRVHQPEYLNVCTEEVPTGACQTYHANALSTLDALDVPAREKLAVVAGSFLGRSELHTRAKRLYRAGRQRLLRAHIPLPEWNWERSTSAPLGTMPVWNRVAADLANARRGEFVYAHLLMPHYPYMYDAACRPSPPSRWLTRSDASDAGVPGGISNSRESRAARYSLYLQQVRCAERRIDALLAAIPPPLRRDAIVIIQGDHGSRIGLVDPVTTADARMAPSDYADHFSTLFAVRAPAVTPGYDLAVTPITCLLRTLAQSDFQSVAKIDACSTARVVFFWSDTVPEPRPLRAFWTTGGQPAAVASLAPTGSGELRHDPSEHTDRK